MTEDNKVEVQVVEQPVKASEVAKGKKELFDIEHKGHYSEAQLRYWKEELKKHFPEVDDMFIMRCLDAYNYKPEILNKLVEEHKANPESFAKEPLKPEDLEYPDVPEVDEERKSN